MVWVRGNGRVMCHPMFGVIALTADQIPRLIMYDVMDSAYDAQAIHEYSRSLGHVPLIDVNPRRDTAQKEELQAETAQAAAVQSYRRGALSGTYDGGAGERAVENCCSPPQDRNHPSCFNLQEAHLKKPKASCYGHHRSTLRRISRARSMPLKCINAGVSGVSAVPA
jgi:hypothetical protein